MSGITQLSETALVIDKGHFDLEVFFMDGDIHFRWDELITGFSLDGHELNAISEMVKKWNDAQDDPNIYTTGPDYDY